MAKRNKAFYPRHQITEGLFTQGKEWMLTNGTEYIGSYHTYEDGLVMTEPTYIEQRSEVLIQFKNVKTEATQFLYDSITQVTDVKKYTSPKTHFPKPTEDDFRQGFIIRYFVQRRNNRSGKIVEIDNTDFATLSKKGTGIDGNLYKGITLKWKINGPELDTVINNRNVPGVRSTNRRTLFIKEQQMSGITQFLADLLELSIYSKLTDDKFKDLL